MTTAARARYAGYRFPAEIISHAVWLYFRFPLGPRIVEELLAARGIIVSREMPQYLLQSQRAAAREASSISFLMIRFFSARLRERHDSR